MASFRIHEDQENNRNVEIRRPVKEIYQHKRNVLGALNNKQLDGQLRDSKQNLKQTVNEQYQTKKNDHKHVVPVEQFEAFKVYEEPADENKKNAEISKKTTVENVAAIQRIRALPTSQMVIADSPADTNLAHDSPMSIDKSQLSQLNELLIKTPIKSHRELIYDVKEYRDDIYKYMRECETRHRPKPGYMKKQPDITYTMRTVLVDWLVEVAEEYKLHPETLFLAVSYIDRFLSYMSVVRAKLQLVGTAAMFIASKYEEIYPPEVGEFVYITDDTYTKKQVLRMEHLILKVLSFDLSVPTPLSFVTDFCTEMKLDAKTMSLAMYISELSLLDADPFLQFLPSHIASGAIALARYTLEEIPWPVEFEEATGYTLEHLRRCIAYLNKSFSNATTLPQQAIQEKYKHSKYQHVALLLPKEPTADFVDMSVYNCEPAIQETPVEK